MGHTLRYNESLPLQNKWPGYSEVTFRTQSSFKPWGLFRIKIAFLVYPSSSGRKASHLNGPYLRHLISAWGRHISTAVLLGNSLGPWDATHLCRRYIWYCLTAPTCWSPEMQLNAITLSILLISLAIQFRRNVSKLHECILAQRPMLTQTYVAKWRH